MSPKISKAMMEKFFGKKTEVGELNFNYIRKIRRIKKIAKRMFYNKATQEEIEVFEQYKKVIGITSVFYDKYNKEYVLF